MYKAPNPNNSGCYTPQWSALQPNFHTTTMTRLTRFSFHESSGSGSWLGNTRLLCKAPEAFPRWFFRCHLRPLHWAYILLCSSFLFNNDPVSFYLRLYEQFVIYATATKWTTRRNISSSYTGLHTNSRSCDVVRRVALGLAKPLAICCKGFGITEGRQ
jgi:hypothetical protein